jgi:hypothetical protein
MRERVTLKAKGIGALPPEWPVDPYTVGTFLDATNCLPAT